MTDNEKLARWQGWGHIVGVGWCSPNADDSMHEYLDCHDYLNDDAAAMSLLDTLVEKGMMPVLRIVDTNTRLWRVAIYDDYCNAQIVEITGKPTRREAVVAAVLELIGKEDV